MGVEIIEKITEEFVREHLPIYDEKNYVGKITSSVYSPRLQKNIGLAIIDKKNKDSKNLKLKYKNKSIKIKISKLPFLRNK